VSKNDTVTITEAAAMLGVERGKFARIVKAGELTSRTSLLDARRRLISRDQVERIIEEEGAKSRKPVSTQRLRPGFASDGIDTDPADIPASRIKDWVS
jgi:excisionase family DNA binding protein